jgi:hypothetical protein
VKENLLLVQDRIYAKERDLVVGMHRGPVVSEVVHRIASKYNI